MALAKGGYGYNTGSIGMISDGLHSTLSRRRRHCRIGGVHPRRDSADASHPYGYERYELLAAMGIAVLMLAAVWGILDDAWTRFESHESPQVTGLSFAIVIASIFLTIGLSIWEVRSARALSSTLLQADAARIRSDTLVSGAVLSRLGAALGFSRHRSGGFGTRRRNHCLDSGAHCPGRFARSRGCRCGGGH